MLHFEVDNDIEAIIIGNVSIDINAAKAFLENPKVVKETNGISEYPMGNPDYRGKSYRVIHSQNGWSAFGLPSNELHEVVSFEACSEDEFTATLKEAIKSL